MNFLRAVLDSLDSQFKENEWDVTKETLSGSWFWFFSLKRSLYKMVNRLTVIVKVTGQKLRRPTTTTIQGKKITKAKSYNL